MLTKKTYKYAKYPSKLVPFENGEARKLYVSGFAEQGADDQPHFE